MSHDVRKATIEHVEIGVTNAARFYFDENLADSGFAELNGLKRKCRVAWSNERRGVEHVRTRGFVAKEWVTYHSATCVGEGADLALLVENLESLAPEDLSRLTDAGITDLGILLARLARVESREQLCSESGISLDELFRLAKIADIMRIQGVNEGHARLMISAGVGSVAALRACDAPLLLRQLRRMNVELLYLRSLPPESTINRWIEDARSMPDGLIS